MDLQERDWGKKPDGGYGLKMGKGGVGGGVKPSGRLDPLIKVKIEYISGLTI